MNLQQSSSIPCTNAVVDHNLKLNGSSQVCCHDNQMWWENSFDGYEISLQQRNQMMWTLQKCELGAVQAQRKSLFVKRYQTMYIKYKKSKLFSIIISRT